MSNTVNLESRNPIEWASMPNELKVCILKDLAGKEIAKVALCAKQSLDESVKKELFSHRSLITEMELKSLIKRNKDFSFANPVTLDLSFSQCTNEEFLNYLSRFSNLTGIDLSQKEPDSGFRKLVWRNENWLDKLNNLKMINLSGNHLNHIDFRKLLKRCPNIEKLTANRCPYLQGELYSYLEKELYPNLDGKFFIKAEAQIKVLSLYNSYVRLNNSFKEILGNNLEELHSNYINFCEDSAWILKCTNLTALTVSSRGPTDVTLLTTLTKLKRLNISCIYSILNGESLKNLTNLEYISLPLEFKFEMANIAPYWKKMRHISCRFLNCKEISKIKNLEIVKKNECSISELSHLTNLQVLKKLKISSRYNYLDPNEVFKTLPRLEILETSTRYDKGEESLLIKALELKNKMTNSFPDKRKHTYQNPKNQINRAPNSQEKPDCTIS